jgi:sterol desaturase/sphingolipid hydroxylase (fatty acid hydroxylase superfamily)
MAWKLFWYVLTAILTYFIGSLVQATLHALLGHKRIGGILYSTHVYCHHALYSKDHMVSDEYLPEEKDAAPFFIVPVGLIGWCGYELLPFDLFLVNAASIVLCFFGFLYLHKHYHLRQSWLGHFRWFRARQQLHFVHHRHASKNYALITPLWDRIFGTYQSADTGGR